MHLTQDNRLVRVVDEFPLAEVPQSIICLGDSGLIQFSSGYTRLDLSNGQTHSILDKMEPTKLSMKTVFDQFLIEGPGHLGVFLNEQGLPARPPVQLSPNLDKISQMGEYLAVTDGEFTTILGEEDLKQLQIVPVPGVKFLAHSATCAMQFCATTNSVFSLTQLPFYSIAFHLLSQGEIDQALEVVDQAEQESPPLGLDEMDVELYTRRIRAVCACLLIGRDSVDYKKPGALFDRAGFEWEEVLSLFNEYYELFSFIPKKQSIDHKYLKAVPVENVVAFLASESMARIVRAPRRVDYVKAYGQLMLHNGATQLEMFAMINELVGLKLSSEAIEALDELFENSTEKYPSCVARLKWSLNQFEPAFDIWSKLDSGALTDSTYGGVGQIGPLVVECFEAGVGGGALEAELLSNLGLFLTDPNWFVRITAKMNLDEQKMIERLNDHPEVKVVYLEQLVESKTNKEQVYMELAKLYLMGENYTQLRKFVRENDKKVNHEKVAEWLDENDDCSVDRIVLSAETHCRLGKIEEGLQSLLDANVDSEHFDQVAYQSGRKGLTIGAQLLQKTDTTAFAKYTDKFAVHLAPALLESLDQDSPISDISGLILGLLRSSQRKKRAVELEAELTKESIVDSINEFNSKNIKIERGAADAYGNRCKVTGKMVKSDFYLFPSGMICLPSAAASTDVDPLTGELLSVHISK